MGARRDRQIQVNGLPWQTSAVLLLNEVTVATKRGIEELKRIDAIVRRRRLLNRSDLVRQAIKLYLTLSSLDTDTRLRMLRLFNESVGVSGKTGAQLVEEALREEDC